MAKTNAKKLKYQKKQKKQKAKTRKLKRGGNSMPFLMRSTRLSCAPNKLKGYKTVGIIHHTEAGGINFLRDFGSDLANTVGLKGFDSAVYDDVRNRALDGILKNIGENQKVNDIKMDVENHKNMVLVHAYGTLYEKA